MRIPCGSGRRHRSFDHSSPADPPQSIPGLSIRARLRIASLILRLSKSTCLGQARCAHLRASKVALSRRWWGSRCKGAPLPKSLRRWRSSADLCVCMPQWKRRRVADRDNDLYPIDVPCPPRTGLHLSRHKLGGQHLKGRRHGAYQRSVLVDVSSCTRVYARVACVNIRRPAARERRGDKGPS